MGLATTEPQLRAHDQETLEVRRNAGIFGLASLAAAVMAVAYGWRAASDGSSLLWLLVAVLFAVGVFCAAAWYDARSPLLVADTLGVRLRNGRDWEGLPWEDVADVVVHPRHGLLRDGEVEVVPHHGAGYVVPIGLATVCSSPDVAASVRALTSGQTAVTVVDRSAQDAADSATNDTNEADEPSEPAHEVESLLAQHDDESQPVPPTVERPAFARTATVQTAAQIAAVQPASEEVAGEKTPTPSEDPGVEESGVEERRDLADDGPAAERPDADPEAEEQADPDARDRAHSSPVALVASARRAIRANVARSRPASEGTAALKAEPGVQPGTDSRQLQEARDLRGKRGQVDLAFDPVPQIPQQVAVDAAPIEEWPAQAADDPVIGPQLAAVRERSGVTVDGLAERTRIRPHVLEAIEVDDFAPCGGDFYARGHIRSIARVLGVEADELVATYDARYAHAPVDARRVFEAELATGPRPSIRLAKGGPNWAVLLGVVMVLAIIWGLGQFLTDDGQAPATTPSSGTSQEPEPQSGDRDSVADLGAPTSNEVVLRGVGERSKVVVEDHAGNVRWKGHLSEGDKQRLTVPGRVTIKSAHGDAVRVRTNGNAKGTVGDGDGKAKTVRGRH